MKTIADLKEWMTSVERENLEFKAKRSVKSVKLAQYCSALANEGGGHLILGVTNTPPRRVVGSDLYRGSKLEEIKFNLLNWLRHRVEAYELDHPDGRVVIFDIPGRPKGLPISYKGACWMRAGESLVPMTSDQLKKIYAEDVVDYSAEICPGATIQDLDASAISRFSELWIAKSGKKELEQLDDKQLLSDAELVSADGVTYAALVLLGSSKSLGKYLDSAEVIFEYRSNETSVNFEQRKEYREGFLMYMDDLWETINLRNDIYHYHSGLFIWDIHAFNEKVVREAILNAVSHREYRDARSIFVRQFPKKLEIKSPGGLPDGITIENIVWEQNPRNRRIASVLSKCGLVERSGQGVNRMFEVSIKEGKLTPDFQGTTEHQVIIAIYGEIQDERFLRFLEDLGKERLAEFSIDDLLVLHYLNTEQPLPDRILTRLPRLAAEGIIERVGRTRSARYILSRRLYSYIGKKGVYTQKKGLDKPTNKALLLQHIQENQRDGSKMSEFMQVLPGLSRDQIKALLRELKNDGEILVKGRTKSARWYPITS